MRTFEVMGMLGRLRGAADVITGKAEAVAPGTGEALLDLKDTVKVAPWQEVIDALRADRDMHKHKADKLFVLVEGVLAERDTWQNMFKIHASEHLNAQNYLENALTRTWVMLVKTIKIVNEYRERNKEPLLEIPEAPTPGVAKAFEEKMKALEVNPVEAYERLPHDPASAFESQRTRSMRVGIGNQDHDKIVAERDRIMAEERRTGELGHPEYEDPEDES